MKKIIVKILQFVKKIIQFILAYTTPRKLRKFDYQNVKKGFEYFSEDEIKDSYNHFKKHFYEAIFLENKVLQKHAIERALETHEDGFYYLEFGVYIGSSLNLLAGILQKKNISIYGFDSFQGLREDWSGTTNAPKGLSNTESKIPKLKKNSIPVKGWIQETLPKFINEKKSLKIHFIHIDLDTYKSTKDVLKLVKPYLTKNAVILFDELYNYSGWKVGEYKALSELFDEKEYRFISFATHSKQATIQLQKN